MASQLVHPLTGTLLLLLATIVALALHWRRAGLALAGVAFVSTWLVATPAFSHWLRLSLERAHQPLAVEQLPAAEAIVVLGSGVQPAVRPRAYPNLRYAADRVWHGARLYAAGKAPLIITTGSRPYHDEGPTAADAAAEILGTLGVPADAIVAPGHSVSTYTDALIVRKILAERGLERVLLVTSALHMPRALATFQNAGIAVFPAATDFEVADVPYAGAHAWLPDNDAFWGTGRALYEYVGIAWYRLTDRM